jgi:hypothetical protein
MQGVFKRMVERGLALPHAYDPAQKKPSFRLLTAYISFLLSVCSLIALHFYSEMVIASAMSMLFFGICMVFYMLKKLDSARIDLDDQEISLNVEKEVDNS